MLTELDAVNIMLSAVGESPVSTLESLHPDVLSSTLLLKHARLTMLAPGKWFNTETGLTLNITSTGEIILPSTCISVDPVDTTQDYVKRGTRLYNAGTHSFVFASGVTVDMVIDMPFVELPLVAQNVVVLNAALVLQANFIGDDRKLQVLTARHTADVTALNAEEIKHGDYNARNSPAARKLLSGVRNSFGVSA